MVELKVYDVIKRTRVSSKVKWANEKQSKIIIDVHINANKVQIKQAIKILFGFDALSVNVIVVKGKTKKSASRYVYKDSDYKKAIIKITKGSDIGSLKPNNEEFVSDLNSNNNIRG